jgi:hypothetical protein
MAQKKITDLTLRSNFDETVNLPGDDTTQTYRVTGQQIRDYITSKKTYPNQIENLTISTSVASSALTIALKTKGGTDASTTDPINVAMRSATLTSGVYNLRQITGALSMVVSSGSTLGQVDTKPSYIYVYLIDNSGTLELAVSHSFYPDDALISTTAEGGAGAADSATTIYSTATRTTVPIRYIGYILNTQTTAGTWASAGTEIQTGQTSWTAPTIQKLTSGTTYYTPAGAKFLKVRWVGAGGGGCGIGASTAPTGSVGGTTSFNGITAIGGSGGLGSTTVNGQLGGAGGTGGTGTADLRIPGQAGFPGPTALGGTGSYGGGAGGNSYLGFGGAWTGQGVNGNAGTGYGSGGSGAGGAAGATNSGGGGGGGEYCELLIKQPAASYPMAIGTGGAGGIGTGTGAKTGGAGIDGVIEVTEYY